MSQPKRTEFEIGDIVLVKSCAGDEIPPIHVKLTAWTFPGPNEWGVPGWEATVVYEEEAKVLRKEWSIPLHVGSLTYVPEELIIKKENDEL